MQFNQLVMRTDNFFCPFIISPLSQACMCLHIPAIKMQEGMKNRGKLVDYIHKKTGFFLFPHQLYILGVPKK